MRVLMSTALMHATPGRDPNCDFGRKPLSSAWLMYQAAPEDDLEDNVQIFFDQLDGAETFHIGTAFVLSRRTCMARSHLEGANLYFIGRSIIVAYICMSCLCFRATL